MKRKHKLNSFLYNHLWLKRVFDYAFPLFLTILSAVIFSFGLNVFIQPELLGVQDASSMVSGGSSGLAQVFKSLAQLIKSDDFSEQTQTIIFNVCYFAINIPLLLLAYFGVGKRFGIFTLINVGCVILFDFLFTIKGTPCQEALNQIASHIQQDGGGELSRAFFAGICTGLSSAIAFKAEASAGGFDVVSYYLSNKKSTLAGKYGVVINGLIITAFAIVTGIKSQNIANAITSVCFSLVYLLTVMLVIDVINVRNKKAQLEIITSNKELPKLLIANIPHGATIAEAKGVFTEDEKIIIYMVVSTVEVKRAVSIIKALDPESFVNVVPLQAVYGNFHIKPVK